MPTSQYKGCVRVGRGKVLSRGPSRGGNLGPVIGRKMHEGSRSLSVKGAAEGIEKIGEKKGIPSQLGGKKKRSGQGKKTTQGA